MRTFVADLHIHSRFSRATSKALNLVELAIWARKKGLTVVGTGDFTHPAWFGEIREQLVPTGDGLFRLRDDLEARVDEASPASCHGSVRFILQVEISNIYKRADKVRKVHNLVYMPSLEAASLFNEALEKVGNIRSDGRPILGLDSEDLLEIVLETDPAAFLIPAHVWTPWFSVLGSKGGFDSIEACYGSLTKHIFALETGLSSDPAMNWRLSALDGYVLVSNSDAHSASKLAREANLFSCEPTYEAMLHAMRTGEGFEGTVEFYPEEGKYHLDGHRKCGVRLTPAQTKELGGLCPVCGKPVTVGVMHRVEALADRPDGFRPEGAKDFVSLVGLANVLSEVYGRGPATKTVLRHYEQLVGSLGGELDILMDLPLEDIEQRAGPLVAEAISRVRSGRVRLAAGFDGEYGRIFLFGDDERKELSGQGAMFSVAGVADQVPGTRRGAVRDRDGGPDEPEDLESLPLFPGVAEEKTEPTIGGGETSVGSENVSDPGHAPSSELVEENEPDLESLPLFPGFVPAGAARAYGGFANPVTDPEELLFGLTDEQKSAVQGPGPMCIVAGPGAGKTRVLTTRIAHRILSGVDPKGILAVTFTNLAAKQLAERISAMVGAPGEDITVDTFHGFCASLVRSDPEKFGLAAEPTLVDRATAEALVDLVVPGLTGRKRGRVLDLISARKTGRDVPAGDSEELDSAVRAMEDYMAEHALWDLDDLIAKPLAAFERDEALARDLRARYPHLFVDEYQDVSPIQERLVDLLAPPSQESDVTVIGDPDQSIYGFRGADPHALERFVSARPTCKLVRLTRSFRSPDLVLAAAGRIVGRGDEERVRSDIRFWSKRIPVALAATDKAEAEYVVATVERMVGGTGFFSLDSGRAEEDDQGAGFGDVAVLFRTRHQAEALVEAFSRSAMPFEVASSSGRWSSAMELLLGVARLARDPADPLWRKYVGLAAAAHAAEHSGEDAQWLERRAAALAIDLTPRVSWSDLVERSLAWFWAERPKVADAVRVEAEALPGDLDLNGALVRAGLHRAQDRFHPKSNRVHLMTIHAAKGLEFDTVFLTGFEDGLLPLVGADIEEERRLFYVALTRASRRLEVTAAKIRAGRGTKVSRFIDDLTAWTQTKDAFIRRHRPKQLNLF